MKTGKFIEVSSLTPKLFIPKNNGMTTEQGNIYKSISEGQYWALRTPPSIQQTTVQNFYIGSNF